MSLSETTTFEPTAAELINLKKILEMCTVPDVGAFAIQPGLSLEQHYCFALDQFDTTSRVFDGSCYDEEVLSIVMNEEKLDELLASEARAKGVLEAHFPLPKRRRTRSGRSQIALLSTLNIPRSPDTPQSPGRKQSTTFLEPHRPPLDGRPRSSPVPSLQQPDSARPSFSFSSSENKITKGTSTFGSFRIPTAANSVVSFMSGSSSSSLHPYKHKGRRRDSLMQFFRRDTSRSSISKDSIPALPEEPHSYGPPSIAEVPELSSPNSHESQDLSSLQSFSERASTRTSTSSFVDHNPPLSTLEKRSVDRFTKKDRFRKLQQQCDEELIRFNDFAQHQRVALPLILGRNRLYMEERKHIKLVELRKQQRAVVEQLENRHVGKELVEMERHRMEAEDNAVRNATALKHVQKRLSLLGEDASPEQRKRLLEEVSAPDRLARKHDREMQALIRNQEREKLDLQRQQEKDLEEYSKSLDEQHATLAKQKLIQLGKNMIKLDDLIEDRRYRLVARWYLRLQVAKMEDEETALIKAPLPLSILDLPQPFTASLGYT